MKDETPPVFSILGGESSWGFDLQAGNETSRRIERAATGLEPLEQAHAHAAALKCPKVFFKPDEWQAVGCDDFYSSTLSLQERRAWMDQVSNSPKPRRFSTIANPFVWRKGY